MAPGLMATVPQVLVGFLVEVVGVAPDPWDAVGGVADAAVGRVAGTLGGVTGIWVGVWRTVCWDCVSEPVVALLEFKPVDGLERVPAVPRLCVLIWLARASTPAGVVGTSGTALLEITGAGVADGAADWLEVAVPEFTGAVEPLVAAGGLAGVLEAPAAAVARALADGVAPVALPAAAGGAVLAAPCGLGAVDEPAGDAASVALLIIGLFPPVPLKSS